MDKTRFFGAMAFLLFLGSIYYTSRQSVDIPVFVAPAKMEDCLDETAVQNADTVAAQVYQDSAKTFLYVRNNNLALCYFRNAAAIFEAASKRFGSEAIWHQYISCRMRIGELLPEAEAIGHLQETVVMAEDRLPPPDPFFMALYKAVGDMYDDWTYFDLALEYYQKSLNLYEHHGDTSSAELAKLYNNMGVAYRNLGDLPRAMRYHKKSLKIREQFQAEDYRYLFSSNLNIGINLHAMQETDSALVLFRKCVDLCERYLRPAYEKNPKSSDYLFRISTAYSNLGDLYNDRGDYDEALKYHFKSLQIREQIYGAGSDRVKINHRFLGSTYAAMAEYEKAVEHYNISIELIKRQFLNNHALLAEVQLDMSDLYKKQGKYSEALHYAHASLLALDSLFTDTDVTSAPAVENVLSISGYAEAMSRKAVLFQLLFEEAGSQPDNLAAEALRAAHLAVEGINVARQNVRFEGSKLYQAAENKGIIEIALDIATRQSAESLSAETVNSIHAFMENGHAAVLYEAIQNGAAKNLGNLPDSLRKRERRLRRDLRNFRNARDLARRSRKYENFLRASHYDNILFDLERASERLNTAFEKTYPGYHEIKYNDERISLPMVQARLVPGEVLIEYFLGQSGLYSLAVSNTRVSVARHDHRAQIGELSGRLLSRINAAQSADENPVEQVRTAGKLYEILISPHQSLLNGADKLLIIPDEHLYFLPFGALVNIRAQDYQANSYQVTNIDTATNTVVFKNLDYLICRAEVSTHYSATLALPRPVEGENIEQQISGGLLAMAPVFDGSPRISAYRAEIEPLQHSEEELKAIREVMGAKNSLYLFRGDATEGRFNAHAEKARWIHLSTHAQFDKDYPELSSLLFFRNDSVAGVSSSPIYVNDIYGLSLMADLVVLSACETAVGRLHRGEGAIGLTRSFIQAGARNVVSSLWKVDDHSTSVLMAEYYKRLKQGESYGTALRSAKLMMIRETRWGYPKAWAPFILVGRGNMRAGTDE